MGIQVRRFWQGLIGHTRSETGPITPPCSERSRTTPLPPLAIAPNDPIVEYFQRHPTAVEIDRLGLDSPALREMRNAGVKLVVPLVSQGKLIGALNLGPRLSGQEYSVDDLALLNNLATQAAPAVRVAQLVHEQQTEARLRERIEHEPHVARLIQQTLLPKQVPTLPGWRVAVHYQPAQAIGGDFYDFLHLPDSQLGIVVGDASDKGVPAALVMASTRSILRSMAQRLASPAAILERLNELLCPDMPPNMFVTGLCAVLDPATGRIRFANAGHNLPYRRSATGVETLRITGMPLGLMPGVHYEEQETILAPGDTVLFCSDGLTEAHSPAREMFGFPRLAELMSNHPGGPELIAWLLEQLAAFTGSDWEQEDDVTLLVVQRSSGQGPR